MQNIVSASLKFESQLISLEVPSLNVYVEATFIVFLGRFDVIVNTYNKSLNLRLHGRCVFWLSMSYCCRIPWDRQTIHSVSCWQELARKLVTKTISYFAGSFLTKIQKKKCSHYSCLIFLDQKLQKCNGFDRVRCKLFHADYYIMYFIISAGF